jgi:hypothetical protein
MCRTSFLHKLQEPQVPQWSATLAQQFPKATSNRHIEGVLRQCSIAIIQHSSSTSHPSKIVGVYLVHFADAYTSASICVSLVRSRAMSVRRGLLYGMTQRLPHVHE